MTPQQVRRCLWILLVSASLLSVLAILDSLGIWHAGGPWASATSGDTGGRGGATLASPIAVGDYLSYSFAVVLVWLLRRKDHRRVLLGIAGVIFLGILGTGQFSAWISCFIVVMVVAHHEGQLGRLAKWLAPIAASGRADRVAGDLHAARGVQRRRAPRTAGRAASTTSPTSTCRNWRASTGCSASGPTP